jgi:hypothetical protein
MAKLCYRSETKKTKSGTNVIVIGKTCSKKGKKPKRSEDKILEKTGKQFVKIYDNNFTKQEQRQIGNIFYDFYNNKNTNAQISGKNKGRVGARTSYFAGERAEQLNPGYKKMIDMTFNHKALKDKNKEISITHELIHAKKFMSGKPGSLWSHNEKKIEFETVGRVSEEGVLNYDHGYYWDPASVPLVKKADKEKWSNAKYNNLVKQGIKEDRILLTGSLVRHMIGKPIEKQVKQKFQKSFFLKKKLENN